MAEIVVDLTDSLIRLRYAVRVMICARRWRMSTTRIGELVGELYLPTGLYLADLAPSEQRLVMRSALLERLDDLEAQSEEIEC